MRALLLLFAAAAALEAVPVLVASHKLVPGLRADVGPPLEPHAPGEVTNMLKRLVTECSSDVYILMSVPGLSSVDLTTRKADRWPHLQKYLYMASTVVGLPWVEGTLDMGFMEQYIVRTCKAEAVQVFESDEEVAQYSDTRRRVVKVDVAPLPADAHDRDDALRSVDDLLRKILRKVPLPHYTIVLTSSEVGAVHPVPAVALESNPEHFEVFYDVLHDPLREHDVERNQYLYRDVEPYWNEGADPVQRYLANKRGDDVRLLDPDLWRRYERLVATVALMVASLFAMETLSLGRRLRARFMTRGAVLGVRKQE